MRQLKNFMKAKKPMWRCGECKCLTLQCRKENDELCNCGDASAVDMVAYGLAWFKTTPVYTELTPEAQVQALEDAEEILTGLGDGISVFYYAARAGKTFAEWAEENDEVVDETGTCADVMANQNAFVFYITAMGNIECKHLAEQPTRGRSANPLKNQDPIERYLNELTTSSVTYTFKDWNGLVLKIDSVKSGGTPVAPANPVRPSTIEHTYTFSGWSPEVGPITQDTSYRAQYTEDVREYTITFVDYDGTLLDEQQVAYGETPVYSGETPTRDPDEQYNYTFNGWDPAITTVTGDATYTATYTATLNLYITIDQEQSDSTGAVADEITVYYDSNGDSFQYYDNPDLLSIVSSTNSSVTFTVTGEGLTHLTISAVKNGQSVSDVIAITCTPYVPTIPANAVVLSTSGDACDDLDWSSANIFQIGPGFATGTNPALTTKMPRGPDYINWDGTTAATTGAYANDAHMVALAGDSDMLGYINTAISGVIDEINNDCLSPRWSLDKGHIFFTAAYWTALNTYFSAATPDVATLKSAFATLIGNSTPMFSGYEEFGGTGAYAPYNVEAEYDKANDMTTVKIFKDDRGDYIQFRTIWNGQGGYATRLDKRDNSVGAVMKTIFDESWGGASATMATYRNNLDTAFIDMAEEIKDKMGVSTMSGVYATWSGTFDTSGTYFHFIVMTMGIFGNPSVSNINGYMEDLHQNAGNLFITPFVPVIPANSINMFFGLDEDTLDTVPTSMNIFQLGCGGTMSSYRPLGTDYMLLSIGASSQDSSLSLQGDYANNPHMAALLVDDGNGSFFDFVYTGMRTFLNNNPDYIRSIDPEEDMNYQMEALPHLSFSPAIWGPLVTYFSNETPDTQTLYTALIQALALVGFENMFTLHNTNDDINTMPLNVSYDSQTGAVKFLDDNNGYYLEMEMDNGTPVLTKYDNNVGAVMKSVLDKSWGGREATMNSYYTSTINGLTNIYNTMLDLNGGASCIGKFNTDFHIHLNTAIPNLCACPTAQNVEGFASTINDAIDEYDIIIPLYTITFESISNTTPVETNWGTVSPSEVAVPTGTTITHDNSGTLYVGETEVTATPESGYEFIYWKENGGANLPASSTVNGDMTISAVFKVEGGGE